jgi:superfamily II DNA or RNA helicase
MTVTRANDTGRPFAPAPGVRVIHRADSAHGFVETSRRSAKGIEVKVIWFKGSESAWVVLEALRSGIQPGQEIKEIPSSPHRPSYGVGTVLATRTLAGSEQALIEFWERGESLWLPWQNLQMVRGARHRFINRSAAVEDHAERFRLRSLAYALEQWHANTGALSTLDIDPLPHQLHLVDHILSSGNLNWMIADDVGLGKTIEVGLLLSALKRRGLRRFLLVVPAGLTQQWQEELRERFRLDEFLVYGRDFAPERPEQWRMFDHVIGSMDRFKAESHLESLRRSGHWDVIIFDEGHRLSRAQYGMKFTISDRFRLADMLRRQTDSMLLLTGTPHQGKDDKFGALLELLRPEWREAIRRLRLEPGFLKDVIIRNLKADVTDIDGNFVFKGKITRTIGIEITPTEQAFDADLHQYLLEGYGAGKAGGDTGRAIGFVMTTYRKLAASSLQAITDALAGRRNRLIQGEQSSSSQSSFMPDAEADARFEGETEEQAARQVSARAFFDGELEMLERLILQAQALLPTDSKRRFFLDELVNTVLAKNPSEKVLIFTEYRTTQRYLEGALIERFGASKVQTIHGGKKHDERREAIRAFEDDGQFLISTEAGGEGLNLQRECHTMINFDLPWNPMRLVQRVGRLYRYGQQHPVLVFNVQTPQTLDSKIIATMYERLNVVAAAMVLVGDEYQRERLEEDILGDLVGALDIENILEEALQYGIERTQDRINQAMERAKQAANMQRDLLNHASSYKPGERLNQFRLGVEHLRAFIEGMFQALQIPSQLAHNGRAWSVELPEDVATLLGLKRRLTVTTERTFTLRRGSLHLLDADSPLLRYLFESAKAADFGGLVARLSGLSGESVVTAMLRWQNERGKHTQEYFVVTVSSNGQIAMNPPEWSNWLLEPKSGAQLPNEASKNLLEIAQKAIDQRLADRSNADIYPGGQMLINAGWIDQPDE